jgi:hypothetical protein
MNCTCNYQCIKTEIFDLPSYAQSQYRNGKTDAWEAYLNFHNYCLNDNGECIERKRLLNLVEELYLKNKN